MSRRRNSSDFNDVLDKATDASLSEPDRNGLSALSEMINYAVLDPVEAINAINKKLLDVNPKTVTLALEVLRTVTLDCSFIIYRVTMMDSYMDFLKGIFDSTRHQAVKDMILKLIEEWVLLLDGSPISNAPRKLLEILQTEGYVFTRINQQNDNKNKTEISDQNQAEKISVSEMEFKKSLAEIKERQRQKHKAYLKSQGLPTSSDEEEEKVKAKSDDSNTPKEETEPMPKKAVISKELDEIKKQRLRLDAGVRELRMEKHQDFVKNGNNCELRQCQKKNCEHCNEYKKKPEPENVVIPKQLPKELKKIKDSRAILKDNFQEIKELKRQKYYGNLPNSDQQQSSPGNSGLLNGQKLGGVPLSKTEVMFHSNRTVKTRAMLEENEELRKALEISVYDRGNGPLNPYDDDECDDEDDVNEDEDLQIKLAMQLSFEAAGHVSDKEPEKGKKGECLICSSRKYLTVFMPCRHRCICAECAQTCTLEMCLQCQNPIFD